MIKDIHALRKGYNSLAEMHMVEELSAPFDPSKASVAECSERGKLEFTGKTSAKLLDMKEARRCDAIATFLRREAFSDIKKLRKGYNSLAEKHMVEELSKPFNPNTVSIADSSKRRETVISGKKAAQLLAKKDAMNRLSVFTDKEISETSVMSKN